MKARWVQITQGQTGISGIPLGPPATSQWMAVDEEDEIIAHVVGDAQLWQASTAWTGSTGATKNGAFISESAAKRRVEKWMQATHTFLASGTAWVYAITP